MKPRFSAAANTFARILRLPPGGNFRLPSKKAVRSAKKAAKQGKAPTTQASEFVHEEMHKLKHHQGRAKNPRQAIAIGLSEARREGVKLPPPPANSAAGKRARKKSTKKAAAKKTATKRSAARKKTSGTRHSAKKTSASRKRTTAKRKRSTR